MAANTQQALHCPSDPLRPHLPSLLHPVLFAAWPALALYGEYADRLFPALLTDPIAAMAGSALILVGAFWVVTRNLARAAVMASLVVIAFYVVWKPVVQDRITVWSMAPPWAFNTAYVFLLAVVLFLLHRSGADFRKLTPGVNFAACALVSWPIVQIVRVEANRQPHAADLTATPMSLPDGMANAQHKPNVVLIILDEYPRADYLLDAYGFDNGGFIDALEQRGFRVAAESTSDYDSTMPSIPSLLNMAYIHELGIAPADYHSLHQLVMHNRVNRSLDAMGYTTHAFVTGFGPTEPGPAIDFVHPSRTSWSAIDEFRGALIQFTPWSKVFQLIGNEWEHEAWRDHLLYILENVHRPIAESGGEPVHVRAHLLCPHVPFVFGADGGPHFTESAFAFGRALDANDDAFSEQIFNQIQGLNRHVIEAVDRILDASTNPPIIIITSDHGAKGARGSGRAREILLAVHLPRWGDSVQAESFDSIRLVNLFRFVFNVSFDAGFRYREPVPDERRPRHVSSSEPQDDRTKLEPSQRQSD